MEKDIILPKREEKLHKLQEEIEQVKSHESNGKKEIHIMRETAG